MSETYLYDLAWQHVKINYRGMLSDGWNKEDAIHACINTGLGQKVLREKYNYTDEDIKRLVVNPRNKVNHS